MAKAKKLTKKKQLLLLPIYNLKLNLRGSNEYKSTGKTLLEAFANVEVKEDFIKTIGTLTVSYKDKEMTRLVGARILHRMFGKLSKEFVKKVVQMNFSKLYEGALRTSL